MITVIPFEFIDLQGDGFHLSLKVKVNNIEATLILDTGASRTVFDVNRIERFVAQPEMEENEQLSTGLGTNSMQSQMLTFSSLCIGNMQWDDYVSVAIDMQHINQTYEMLNMPLIDGVLGGDILHKFKAVIDYKRQELKLRFPKKMMVKEG
ncbi:MAG: clan AA aspartic protease [Bacteroidetes bacterium 4572_77]|nr:MAG: clan AA aspartic protease [Bacteroidetes bacterium 4572_77]